MGLLVTKTRSLINQQAQGHGLKQWTNRVSFEYHKTRSIRKAKCGPLEPPMNGPCLATDVSYISKKGLKFYVLNVDGMMHYLIILGHWISSNYCKLRLRGET